APLSSALLWSSAPLSSALLWSSAPLSSALLWSSAVPSRRQHPLQHGLRRVQPVLGLVPHGGGGAVDDLGVDLLAAVRRQAVHGDGARGGIGHDGRADGEAPEPPEPLLELSLLPDADPDVGVEDVGSPGSGGGLVRH